MGQKSSIMELACRRTSTDNLISIPSIPLLTTWLRPLPFARPLDASRFQAVNLVTIERCLCSEKDVRLAIINNASIMQLLVYTRGSRKIKIKCGLTFVETKSVCIFNCISKKTNTLCQNLHWFMDNFLIC